jgi:RNA polymerase sigma-70 factor (ECF subfamily)
MLDHLSAADAPVSGLLDQLLRRYLPALRAHLILGRGLGPEMAEELLQEFVLSKILQQGVLGRADRARGRFRTFILSVLDRFVIDHLRRSAVRRRHVPVADIDLALPAPDNRPIPSRAFDIAWARTVLAQAVEVVQARFLQGGREDLWLVLKSRVLDPILENQPPPPYEQMVREFGYKTASQACSAVLTARRGLARVLREIVAQYVPEHAVEEEILSLGRILSGAG